MRQEKNKFKLQTDAFTPLAVWGFEMWRDAIRPLTEHFHLISWPQRDRKQGARRSDDRPEPNHPHHCYIIRILNLQDIPVLLLLLLFWAFYGVIRSWQWQNSCIKCSCRITIYDITIPTVCLMSQVKLSAVTRPLGQTDAEKQTLVLTSESH